ncbi:CHASE3 domain-containing protein [Chitiniphilus purpureus]|uniref:histidine kinase n=1 Tax=Chitiniphilus purpureus TaxID=2981137 RepID=A0ABY6DQN0_9NEIS|nr:CHASE3 domain-containing protein [Chitiniphilus sp. CD1]UXY15396.1 CHASE3 domain-containing protein [Chitiniphilus sp. CD1]
MDKAYAVARQLGWRLCLTLLACIVSALLSFGIHVMWIEHSEAQLRAMVATRARLELLARIDSALVRAESAQRGYLIMGNSSYLAPYDRRAEEARNALARLQEDVSRDPAARQRLAAALRRLTLMAGERLAEMDLTIRFVRQGSLDQAHHIIATGAGLRKSLQISGAIEALTGFEQQYLQGQRSGRKAQMHLMFISLAATALLTVLLVLLTVQRLLRELARRQRETDELARHQAELDRLVQERTVQMEKLAIEYQVDVERERYKLSRELHDELGAILTATKIDLSWIQRQIKDNYPLVVDKLNKTLRNLDQGIQFKRQVVQALHPTLLSTFGLTAAIRAHAEEAAQRSNWTLTLNLPDGTERVDDVLALIVYRVLQETLNNAAKYAQADHVSISLISDDDYLKLEIEDNGVGMNLQRLPEGTHGLQGMRHRVIAVGGKIDIHSEPGRGVFTCALIPKTIRSTRSGPNAIAPADVRNV